MNQPTATYEYKLLRRPTEAALNELGADGWRVIQVTSDLRDGELTFVLERQQSAYLVTTTSEPAVDSARQKGKSK